MRSPGTGTVRLYTILCALKKWVIYYACFRAKKFNEVVDSLRKNITREYKAKLTKDQRKAFRSQMWAFRRDPESLSAEEKQALEALFEKIPALRPLYKVRLRFKEIFDDQRVTESRPCAG